LPKIKVTKQKGKMKNASALNSYAHPAFAKKGELRFICPLAHGIFV
jgi:hypothetical protein